MTECYLKNTCFIEESVKSSSRCLKTFTYAVYLLSPC